MNRIVRNLKELAATHRKKLPYVGMAVVILVLYAVSKAQDATTYVYKSENKADFKEGRVLGFQGESIYGDKERLFSKTVKEIQNTQAALRDTTAKLQARVDELEKGKPAAAQSQGVSSGNSASPTERGLGLAGGPTDQTDRKGLVGQPPNVRVSNAPENIQATQSESADLAAVGGHPGEKLRPGQTGHSGVSSRDAGGVSIISFPVKEVPLDRTEGVVLPAGSYVKAKLMTGVEAPEGKTYPVLLQLDYAYIVPNKHKIDLSGCFMIAKSQGDLSTERVQMQADKLSCVSKDGKMFEREVSGFVADDKDNSFAVMGSVNSKQDRVAAMAFLSSIVEGVGKALQQAQTTQQTTPLGGSQSVMTGNGADYLAAGGASNAASQVTQWYLKQAQNLLPTINIGSGQDVWIIMQDTVKLPNDYFRKSVKGGSSESVYSYFSRVLD